MPELVINVPSYIGESYLQVDEFGFCEWVQGITWADIEMQMAWAEMTGKPADSILLSFGACDGGSTSEGFNIINKLQALGLPIRSHISGYAASMAVPLSLAADQAPTMDYTAQLMFHAASFGGGVGAETSKDLRAAADRLDNVNQLVLDYMVANTGQTPEVVTEWMSKDTWFTATQAQAVGLCGTVNPLTGKTTAAAASALITARRQRTAAAVARVSKHALSARSTPKPNAKNAAGKAAKSPRPMAKTTRPITAAARKVAGKPAISPAAQAAKIAAVKAFAADMGVVITAEGDSDEITAEVLSTETDQDGALLYHEGELAQGVAVFYDEELTEAAEDGDFGLVDGRTITVAGGVVESITEASAEGEDETPPASTAAITAAITAALAPVLKRVDDLADSVTALKKVVPSTPKPNARGARTQIEAKGGEGSKKPHPMDNAKTK
jgi:ATP-dependent protease ClpP protease subunit